MITVGIILLIVGILANVGIVWTLGVILLVVGGVVVLMGSLGHEVAGRRHFY